MTCADIPMTHEMMFVSFEGTAARAARVASSCAAVAAPMDKAVAAVPLVAFGVMGAGRATEAAEIVLRRASDALLPPSARSWEESLHMWDRDRQFGNGRAVVATHALAVVADVRQRGGPVVGESWGERRVVEEHEEEEEEEPTDTQRVGRLTGKGRDATR